jgi:4'-phosphopantetheinyl transferase
MPFYKSIQITPNSTLHLWKISEELDYFTSSIKLTKSSISRLDSMNSDGHKKGFLAVRMLLQVLGYMDKDLFYDVYGKPHLRDGNNISISHSHLFSAILISTDSVGLDLELCKEKVLKISSKFIVDDCHLKALSKQEKIKKATVIWGIKEAIFKIKNEKGISFPKHIFESEFAISSKQTQAQLRFNSRVEDFDIFFDFIEEYAFVCAFYKSDKTFIKNE